MSGTGAMPVEPVSSPLSKCTKTASFMGCCFTASSWEYRTFRNKEKTRVSGVVGFESRVLTKLRRGQRDSKSNRDGAGKYFESPDSWVQTGKQEKTVRRKRAWGAVWWQDREIFLLFEAQRDDDQQPSRSRGSSRSSRSNKAQQINAQCSEVCPCATDNEGMMLEGQQC